MSQPEISFKVGAVRAAIFQNTMQRGPKTVTIGKVILEVRYKDKDGQWKSTHSMSANELPKAILALQKAYEYLMIKKPEDATQGTADDDFETMSIPVEKAG